MFSNEVFKNFKAVMEASTCHNVVITCHNLYYLVIGIHIGMTLVLLLASDRADVI